MEIFEFERGFKGKGGKGVSRRVVKGVDGKKKHE
jgi:hypothetical protein